LTRCSSDVIMEVGMPISSRRLKDMLYARNSLEAPASGAGVDGRLLLPVLWLWVSARGHDRNTQETT
jgi:hypothetical protein